MTYFNFKNIIAIGGLIAASGLTTAAHAAFEVRGMPAGVVAQETTLTETMPAPIGDGPTALAVPVAPVTKIEQVTTTASAASAPGVPVAVIPDNEPEYRGFGRDIPLGMAVKQIVPKNMAVVYENADHIDMGANVSWTGDGSWRTTLDKILTTNGLTFSATGDTVRIRPEISPVPTSTATIHRSTAAVGVPTTPIAVVDPAPMAEPVMMASQWTAAPGETLRDVLGRWSGKNGIQMTWASDYNYRLKRPVSMNGSYENAVEGLLDQFRKVEPRPYGELAPSASGGRVLVVRVYGEN